MQYLKAQSTEVNGIRKEVLFMKLKDVKMEDLKEYIDLYLELGATYEGAFMLALEMVVE